MKLSEAGVFALLLALFIYMEGLVGQPWITIEIDGAALQGANVSGTAILGRSIFLSRFNLFFKPDNSFALLLEGNRDLIHALASEFVPSPARTLGNFTSNSPYWDVLNVFCIAVLFYVIRLTELLYRGGPTSWFWSMAALFAPAALIALYWGTDEVEGAINNCDDDGPLVDMVNVGSCVRAGPGVLDYGVAQVHLFGFGFALTCVATGLVFLTVTAVKASQRCR